LKKGKKRGPQIPPLGLKKENVGLKRIKGPISNPGEEALQGNKIQGNKSPPIMDRSPFLKGIEEGEKSQ